MTDLDEPITSLPRTSPLTIKKLNKLGIRTIIDLLNYFPSRHKDYSLVSAISSLQEGEVATIIGQIVDSKYQITRQGTRLQVFKIKDPSGEIQVTFFNQPYLLKLLKKGGFVYVSGTVKYFGKNKILEPADYEIKKNSPPIHTGRLVPIYPETAGISSKTIREKIFPIVSDGFLPVEWLPEKIVDYNSLMDEKSAYREIHFPHSYELLMKARNRLAFDEIFLIEIVSALKKAEWNKIKSEIKISTDKIIQNELNTFITTLPFDLTSAQKKVIEEIKSDLVKDRPMNRFLQGEVGSGKTAVAAVISYLFFLNGYKTLLMAPTEILAQQHYQTMLQLFKNHGPETILITGATKIKTRQKAISNAQVIIGTHALLSEKIFLIKSVW